MDHSPRSKYFFTLLQSCGELYNEHQSLKTKMFKKIMMLQIVEKIGIDTRVGQQRKRP